MKHDLIDFLQNTMQFDLFANQTPSEPVQESYGTTARRALKREAEYQADKIESDKLQRQWLAGKNGRIAEAKERERARTALNEAQPITMVLVSCVSQKAATASKAKDLYISDWFLKARCYAERVGDRWMILSARHGLLSPEAVIEPYDETLYGKRKGERQAWASRVVSSISNQIPPRSRIVILAGEIYREFIVSPLEDKFDVSIPMVGLGIGQQLSYLKKVNQR